MNFLKRLFGKKEKPPVELPDEFLLSEPPDWLLRLKVEFLPDGDTHSLQAQLWTDTKSGSLTVESVTGADKNIPKKSTGDLTPMESGGLLVLLGFSFSD